MQKTTKKARSVKDVISDLEDLRKIAGDDAEVFIMNTQEEGVFDGVGKLFIMKVASTKETHIGIIRSEVFLKV